MDPPEPLKYPAVVSVESDPGVPLAGAEIVLQNEVVATSGEDGLASLELRGSEGDILSASVRCPKGFLSPKEPLTMNLMRLVGIDTTQYSVRCAPTERTAVVIIRAQNGPNLPVLYLGKQVAVTDTAGAAHLHFRLAPETSFDLALVTDGVKSPGLLPANPIASFTTRDRDDVYVFDQKFKTPKRRVVRRTAPVPVGPTPL